MSARLPWPAISAGSAGAVLLAAAIGGSSPVRTLLVVWFFMTCPGMVLARLIELRGAAEEAAVGLGVSLAFNTVVALALVYLTLWSAGAVFAIAAATTVAAALVAGGRRGEEAA